MADVEPWTLVTSFRGTEVRVVQERRPREDGGEDNTGWQCWECSNVLMRFAGRDDVVARILPAPAPTFARLRVLDLSAGAGLVALAFAAAGAGSVSASETTSQLPQLRRNIERMGLTDAVRVMQYYWGESVDALRPADAPAGSVDTAAPWYDLCLASDILYIALRDGFLRELAVSLAALTRVCSAVVFGFEERLIDDESEFMEALAAEGARLRAAAAGREGEGAGAGAAGGAAEVPEPGIPAYTARDLSAACPRGFTCEEIRGADTVMTKELALKGVGGHAETETGDLLWEPPPVRLFVLRGAAHARAAAAASDPSS